MSVNVMVVDPSLYTLAYDRAFCSALVAAGAEVTLVGRPIRPSEHLVPEGFRFRPSFYPLGERLGRARRMVKAVEHVDGMRRLATAGKRERPDIIHLQWLTVPLVDAWFIRRARRIAPVVLTMHNSRPGHGEASWLSRRGDAAAIRGCDGWIAHTEQTRAHLVKLGIPAGRIRLLRHPPLDLGGSVQGRRRERDERKTILQFGLMRPYKGVDVLIRAGILLARRRTDFRIVLAGQPQMDLEPLRAEIAQAGVDDHFEFDLRYLPEADLTAWLDAADLAVFPYHDVDGSGALVVAANAGLPIVASAVGGFAEAPVRDHVSLVPPADPTLLAAELDRLLSDPDQLQALGLRATSLIQDLTSWSEFAKGCLELYAILGAPTAHA